ncbi:MAG: LPS export ABC transporter permease LptF [Burkholderiaceae bacterium]
MLFKKALRRDLANLAGVVFATLFTIMVTTTLIRLLGRAAAGGVDTASVLPLIAFSAINFLPVLLVLTLYIAVLMAITRAYRDSEMVIWFACGQSIAQWIRPVLGFAVPFVVVIAAVAFLVAPWANRQTSDYQKRFAQREDISQVAAGQFRESASASRVFFVESISEDQRSVRNVFVTQSQGEKLTIVAAAGGHIRQDPNGDRFLVLEKGRRYDGDRASPAFRLTEFELYGLRLDPKPDISPDDSARVKSTLELIREGTPRGMGELLWRVSLPISAVMLGLLAVPMSSFNPRVGRSVNLIVALLIYVIYSNLISLSQAWVAQERISFGVGVWVVHAGLAVVVALMYWRRLTLPRLRMPSLRRARA